LLCHDNEFLPSVLEERVQQMGKSPVRGDVAI
jgi:hypothetical protein